MKIIGRLLKIIFPNTQEITEEVIRHYEKNPDELDLIVNREHFNAVYLGVVFSLGIGLTLAARLIQHFYKDSLGEFISTIILETIGEIGIAIFGGAIVAYLIEFLNKRQFQENIQFRREIKRILAERKKVDSYEN